MSKELNDSEWDYAEDRKSIKYWVMQSFSHPGNYYGNSNSLCGQFSTNISISIVQFILSLKESSLNIKFSFIMFSTKWCWTAEKGTKELWSSPPNKRYIGPGIQSQSISPLHEWLLLPSLFGREATSTDYFVHLSVRSSVVMAVRSLSDNFLGQLNLTITFHLSQYLCTYLSIHELTYISLPFYLEELYNLAWIFDGLLNLTSKYIILQRLSTSYRRETSIYLTLIFQTSFSYIHIIFPRKAMKRNNSLMYMISQHTCNCHNVWRHMAFLYQSFQGDSIGYT